MITGDMITGYMITGDMIKGDVIKGDVITGDVITEIVKIVHNSPLAGKDAVAEGLENVQRFEPC